MKPHSLPHFLAVLLLLLSFNLAACRGGDPGETPPGGEDDGITLAITTPTPDSYQNRARFRVRGTAEGTSEVDVNGESASVSGGEWEVFVSFENGPATVTASAGSTSVSVDFFVDTELPQLIVDSPERGSVVDSADSEVVTISGRAADELSGLFVIQINGNIIDSEEDGSFSVERPLNPGLNVFSIAAIDRAQNKSIQWRAVMHGPLEEADQPVSQAATVDVTSAGLNDLAAVIEAYATPQTVMGFLEDGFEDADLTINELNWDELQISMTPRDGYLELELYIEGLLIDGTYHTGDSTIEGDIYLVELTLSQELILDVGTDNELVVVVQRSEVVLESHHIQGSLVEDSSLLRALVRGAITYAFTEFFTELIEGNLYDPEVLIQQFEFLDRTIEIELILEDIIISQLGLRIRLGLAFPAPAHPDVAVVPGALHRTVGPDTGGSIVSPVSMHSTRTALDRVLHAVWSAGLFHQAIGGDDLDFQLPFELTADGLASLLDQRIRDIHAPDTPVELRFRPLLPPVVEFGAEIGDDSIQIEMGDFLIDFYLRPDGAAATHVVTVALYLEVDVDLIFDDQEIRFDIDIRAEGDIAEEPIFAFNRERTVNLITDLIVLIPRLIGNDLKIDGQASFDWATIVDPQIEITGQSRDRFTLGLSIEPATDFIEDDVIVAPGED